MRLANDAIVIRLVSKTDNAMQFAHLVLTWFQTNLSLELKTITRQSNVNQPWQGLCNK